MTAQVFGRGEGGHRKWPNFLINDELFTLYILCLPHSMSQLLSCGTRAVRAVNANGLFRATACAESIHKALLEEEVGEKGFLWHRIHRASHHPCHALASSVGRLPPTACQVPCIWRAQATEARRVTG